MTTKYIAQTIRQQINAGDPWAMAAWGSKDLTILNETKLGDRYQLGGLQFKVNGFKHKGLVMVRLMADDTYTIEIGKIIKLEYKQIKVIEGVYCDELMSTIDGLVER